MTDPTPNLAPTPAAESAEPGPPSRATFDVLPLSREVRETLAEIGYTHPTPVQIAVWEPATRGKDAVVQARTGTGKTAAFGLPIVDHIVRRSVPQVQVLALCPTRELALQVAAEVNRLGKRRNVKVAAVYGGAPMQRQIDLLAEGAQVVVGTPGRVLDHLRRGTLDPRHVRLLVLDEADEMLSMGFEREVTAILDTLPKERQTLLFSATLPPDIERMAKKLHSPEYLTLSGDRVGALGIDHFVYMVPGDKLGALVRVIEVENPESAVVFCNTKDETERVAQALSRQGYDADWLNGDLPQSDREKVMSATREGRLRFLVATDVAARGIDISHLTHVINHDFPQDAESYVHRTGRTGRAGRTGTAISLITPHDVGGLYLLRLTYKIRPIEKQIPTEGELKTRAEADLVAMMVEAFTSRPVHPDDLALVRRLLTHEQHDVIFAGLLRDHLGARPTAQQEASAARRATRAASPADTRPRSAPKAAPEKAAAPARREAQASPPRHAEAPLPAAEPAAAPRVQERAPAREAEHRASARAEAPATPSPAHPQAAPPFQAQSPAPQASPGPAERGPAEGPRARHAGPPERHARSERRGRDEHRGSRFGDGGGRRQHDAGAAPRAPAPPAEERLPVTAAGGTREGTAGSARPQRHADFSTWQPPEEEGDDEPILGASQDGRRPPRTPHGAAEHAVAVSPTHAPAPQASQGPESAERGPAGAEVEGDFAEIYINVGRRDGARAADFQRILTERAGIDRASVRRIRVRERNAFVSVRRDDLAKALAALSGAQVAGKVALAEQARERSEAEGPGEAATPAVAEGPAALEEAIEDAAPTGRSGT